MSGTVNPLTLPAELSGPLGAWHHGVARQAERVHAATNGVERFVDAYLFVIALRQVLRGAQAMLRATSSGGQTDKPLREALATFKGAVGDATKIRDVLTHFDAYHEGAGNLQKAGKMGPLEIHSERGHETYWLVVSGFRVEIGAAALAASDLVDEALNAQLRHQHAIASGRHRNVGS
ncbi:MAG TPA: hypothetical protein VFA11_09675 [Acidimicrobiales bacterium]|nr:hypothetical protein [Acidimicrobiales bacterium]